MFSLLAHNKKAAIIKFFQFYLMKTSNANA